MDKRTLLDFLALAEKLKCNTRHSWTSSGRHESVAEHTYRLMIFAWLVKEEFPECDMDRVMKLCLFHDMGEALTGDIPSFEKNGKDEQKEVQALEQIAHMLPEPYREELKEIFREVLEKKTDESRLLQALDKMEAVIQHNEASTETWLPLEYDLQLTYGQDQAAGIPYMRELREVVRQDTIAKIAREKGDGRAEEEGFYVSTDPKSLTLKRITELLRQAYWAKNRSEEKIRVSVEHSKGYGVFDAKGYMVGYARLISDFATTFYLCDVIIDEKYRGRGLGKLLMDRVMEDVGHLYGILHTEVFGFYEKYGFQMAATDEKLMEKDSDSPFSY